MFHLLSALSVFLSSSTHPIVLKKTNLRVEVQNVRLLKGVVHVGLYRTCPDFPNCKPVEIKLFDAKTNTIQTAFNVEPGDYAIAIYHDENSNGKMDKRIFGIPKEPYGFSNNFKPLVSAPKFSDCRFSVGSNGKAISIKLI